METFTNLFRRIFTTDEIHSICAVLFGFSIIISDRENFAEYLKYSKYLI